MMTEGKNTLVSGAVVVSVLFSSTIHKRKAINRYFYEKGNAGAKHTLVSGAVVVSALFSSTIHNRKAINRYFYKKSIKALSTSW
jgi:hypothetical protein